MDFKDKKLNAYWYYPPDLTQPKVFISELRVGELSDVAQKIIAKYTQGRSTPVKNLDGYTTAMCAALLSTRARPWAAPSFADYDALGKESEYASWVLAYGNELNHFTISVNFLKKIKGIQALNDLLEKNGIRLNDAGGKIKGSRKELLMQSSTVADLADVAFADGIHHIPYSYLEFAERFAAKPGNDLAYADCYQGFIPGNADKIFESTYKAQVNKPAAAATS